MSDQIALHILTQSDLASGDPYAAWERGDELARPTSQKRAALLSNPLSLGPQQPVQVIGTKGRRVIGRMDLIGGRVVAQGLDTPILWGSSYFVPEEDRATMMGAMLLMKTQQAFHTVGAHGPSQMAYPLYAKLRWAEIPLQRWIVLRSGRSPIRRYLGHGPLAGVATLGAGAALLAHRGYVGVRRALGAGGLRARRVGAMPEGLDPLLNTPLAAARGHRSAAWFNWLLAHQFGPERRHERVLFLVESRGASSPVGYFLLKVKFYPHATHRRFPDLTLASLADAGVFDPARCSLEALTMLAMKAAGGLRADALEVCDAPGRRSVFYRSLGFLPAGTMRLMFRAVAPSPLAEARWKDPANWDIRLGDGENVPS